MDTTQEKSRFDNLSKIAQTISAGFAPSDSPSNIARVMMRIMEREGIMDKCGPMARMESQLIQQWLELGLQYLNDYETKENCTFEHLFEVLIDGTFLNSDMQIRNSGWVAGSVGDKGLHPVQSPAVLLSVFPGMSAPIQYCMELAKEHLEIFHITNQEDFMILVTSYHSLA